MKSLVDAAGDTHVVMAQDAVHVAASDAVQGVIMPQDTMAAAASDAVQGVVMPQTDVADASVGTRPHLRKITGSVFKTISGFEILGSRDVRQVEPGQVDENGNDIGGKWVITDGVSACTGDSAENCGRWVRNPKNVNKEIAKSLSYIDSGNSSVSPQKLTEKSI